MIYSDDRKRTKVDFSKGLTRRILEKGQFCLGTKHPMSNSWHIVYHTNNLDEMQEAVNELSDGWEYYVYDVATQEEIEFEQYI